MTKPSRVGRYWVYPYFRLPCGKRTKNYGKSPFFIGKFTISMVISHSDVKLPEGKPPFSYGFPMVFPLKPQWFGTQGRWKFLGIPEQIGIGTCFDMGISEHVAYPWMALWGGKDDDLPLDLGGNTLFTQPHLSCDLDHCLLVSVWFYMIIWGFPEMG